jgi:hypothetical protein
MAKRNRETQGELASVTPLHDDDEHDEHEPAHAHT